MKGFVFANGWLRRALANASSESEDISNFEHAGVVEAWEDIELGLVLNHGGTLLREPMQPLEGIPLRRGACPVLVWTRVADLHMMDDAKDEPAIHHAMERFARTGQGQIFSMPDNDEFRMHVGAKRVRFVMSGACVRVLGVFARS
jgi:hypothetical protein